MPRYEPHLPWYLRNIARSANECDDTSRGLYSWLLEHIDVLEVWLGAAIPDDLAESIEGEAVGSRRERMLARVKKSVNVKRSQRLEIAQELERWLGKYLKEVSRPKPLIPDSVESVFGFTSCQMTVLNVALSSRSGSGTRELLEALQTEHDCMYRVLSVCTGIHSEEIRTAMLGQRGLVNAGLVQIERRPHFRSDDWPLQPSHFWNRLRSLGGASAEDILKVVIGNAEEKSLSLKDFKHVGEVRDLAVQLIAGAVNRKSEGVNILLYGPPGNGKSEFARVLASASGCACFAVRTADEDGDPPSRLQRISDLLIGGRLLGQVGNGVILFDEMEDIVASSGFGALRRPSLDSKGFWTQTLEKNPVPVIWTANSLSDFDPFFLRRMNLVVEMGKPPLDVRANIWRKHAKAAGISMSKPQASSIAAKCDASPGLIAKALETTALAKGSADDAVDIIQMVEAAMAGRAAPRKRAGTSATEFDISLVNTSVDLAPILGAIKKQKAFDVSFLLTGEPGTGKTALAGHMADALGMPLIQKRASDILGMYVGQSEANVAAAFQEAADRRAFLFIDEADSLLHSRSGAHRTWEVSLVNEMLTWLQDHPWPVACATNFESHLDEASLRRFTFKLELEPMTKEQAKAAWDLFFPALANVEVALPSGLVPSDFVNARKRSRFGTSKDLREYTFLIKQAMRDRVGKTQNSIGFMRK